MTGDQQPNPRKSWLAPCVVATVILLVLYVLSIGPQRWLYKRGYLGQNPEPAILAFYWPLRVVADHCEPIRTALVWYGSFWDSENAPQPPP
jgi:hypothetical protein